MPSAKKYSYAESHPQIRPYYDKDKNKKIRNSYQEQNNNDEVQKKYTLDKNYRISVQANINFLQKNKEELHSNDLNDQNQNTSKKEDDANFKKYISEIKKNSKQNEEIKNEIKFLREEICEMKNLIINLLLPNDNVDSYKYIPKQEPIPNRKIVIQMDMKFHIIEINSDITLEKLKNKSKECFELPQDIDLIIYYFNKFGIKIIILNEDDFQKSIENNVTNYYVNESNKTNSNCNNIKIISNNKNLKSIVYDDDGDDDDKKYFGGYNNSEKKDKKSNEDLNEKIEHFASLAQKEIETKIEYFLNSADYISDFIKKQKKDPEKLVNTDEMIQKPGLLDKKSDDKTDMDFVLSLIGEILKEKNIDLNIVKNNDKGEKGEKDKDKLSEACLQYLFCGLFDKKKIEINFKLDKQKINILNKKKDELSEFIKGWIEKISDKMKIDKKNISLINPRKIVENSLSSFSLDLVSNDNDDSILKDAKKLLLNQNEINYIKEKSFIESCQLNNDIFDPKYNNQDGFWGFYEKRGGEDYLPPVGWKGYALNVKGKYDYGDNTWLDYKDKEGVFAVAYLGLSNILDNTEKYKKYLGEINLPEILKMNYQQTYKNDYDLRHPRKKCGCGVYLFQNPKIAENSAGIIEIYGIKYKVLLMCRVNPKKIRQPEGYKNCWILNPTPDEIRPYRILVKTILLTPLANTSRDELKFFTEPTPYYKEIIDNKDISFYQEKDEEISNRDYVIKKYTSNDYQYINDYLRDGKLPEGKYTEEQIKSWVWCLHDSLTNCQSNVPNSFTCFRGVKHLFPEELSVGSKFISAEFFSTSKSLDVVFNYFKPETLFIIRIEHNNVPPGFYCYDIENISLCKYEKEILITSNCMFEVTKKEKKTIKELKEKYMTTNIRNSIDENKEILVVYITCLGNYYDLKNNETHNGFD